MSQNETVAEVIANLDVFERDMLRMVAKVREYRYLLFESLDNTDDELVD